MEPFKNYFAILRFAIPQRQLGTTQILNLILEEEKNPAKVGGKSHFCNFFWSKKTGVFPVHFCVFLALLGVFVSIWDQELGLVWVGIARKEELQDHL